MKRFTLLLVLIVNILKSVHAQNMDVATKFSLDEHTSVLLHPSGLALYIFDIDSEDKSNCDNVCAEKWPPIIVTETEAKELTFPFGTIKRNSNLFQVTYKNKPIYLFYLDRKIGDFKGDGLGGVWHLIRN